MINKNKIDLQKMNKFISINNPNCKIEFHYSFLRQFKLIGKTLILDFIMMISFFNWPFIINSYVSLEYFQE